VTPRAAVSAERVGAWPVWMSVSAAPSVDIARIPDITYP
jgi:hypothetical protein